MTTAPGAKRDSCTSSQFPLGPDGCRSTSLPPIVLIATSIRPSFATSAAAAPRPFSCMPFAATTPLASPKVVAPPTGARTRTASASADRFVTGIAPAASSRSGVPELAKSTHVAPQPANPVPSAGTKRGRDVCERAGRGLHVGGGGLVARVGHEEAEAAAGRDAGRHSHSGVRVGDPGGGRALLEAEAEPGRIGARAAGPRRH